MQSVTVVMYLCNGVTPSSLKIPETWRCRGGATALAVGMGEACEFVSVTVRKVARLRVTHQT